MKKCTKCNIDKEDIEYRQYRNRPYRHSVCRACERGANLKRYHTSESTQRSHWTAWQKHRIKKYGLSVEEYEEMVLKTGGTCYICGGINSNGHMLHIDHSHLTGLVRGLLCHNCNVLLGHCKEDVSILRKVAEYLGDSL